jgi:hypothetical protein
MAEGQYTGRRSAYLYTSDAGQQYLIRTDDTLATAAGTGLIAATTGNSAAAQSPPKRFKPRGVHWQGTLNGRIVRKFLICNGGNDASLYSSGIVINLTIDGVSGSTTGRRGEQQSYASLPSAPAAP